MVWQEGRTFLSGAATSGRMLWKGRTSSRNLTARDPQRGVSRAWGGLTAGHFDAVRRRGDGQGRRGCDDATVLCAVLSFHGDAQRRKHRTRLRFASERSLDASSNSGPHSGPCSSEMDRSSSSMGHLDRGTRRQRSISTRPCGPERFTRALSVPNNPRC